MVKKDTFPGLPSGTSTVFMVLCVLCLAVFSVISISAALSEKRLAEKSAEMVSAHYAMEARAFEILAVSESLWQQDNPPDIDVVTACIHDYIYENDVISAYYDRGCLYIDGSLFIDGVRSFVIYAELGPPVTAQSRWNIYFWQVKAVDGEYIDLDMPIPVSHFEIKQGKEGT